jgi:hypothetical protein
VIVILVEAVREGRRRRLVDDALDVEPGDLAGVLGGLALGVIEVRGHRDDRVGHRLTQVVLGRLLQLLKDFCADLGRRELLAADADPGVPVLALDDVVGHALVRLAELVETAADEALDRIDGVLRVGHGLPLGDRAHQNLTLVIPGDHGGRQPGPFLVHDDLGFLAVHHGHDAVGRSQVNSNDLTHFLQSPNLGHAGGLALFGGGPFGPRGHCSFVLPPPPTPLFRGGSRRSRRLQSASSVPAN